MRCIPIGSSKTRGIPRRQLQRRKKQRASSAYSSIEAATLLMFKQEHTFFEVIRPASISISRASALMLFRCRSKRAPWILYSRTRVTWRINVENCEVVGWHLIVMTVIAKRASDVISFLEFREPVSRKPLELVSHEQRPCFAKWFDGGFEWHVAVIWVVSFKALCRWPANRPGRLSIRMCRSNVDSLAWASNSDWVGVFDSFVIE